MKNRLFQVFYPTIHLTQTDNGWLPWYSNCVISNNDETKLYRAEKLTLEKNHHYRDVTNIMSFK